MDQRLEERQGPKRKITSGQRDKRLDPRHESWMHLISDSGVFFHFEAFCSSVLLYSKVTESKRQLISHFTARVYMVCHSGSERHSFKIYILEMCRAFVPVLNYLSRCNIRVHTLLKMTVSQRMKERIVKLNNNPFFYSGKLNEIDFSVSLRGCDINQVCKHWIKDSQWIVSDNERAERRKSVSIQWWLYICIHNLQFKKDLALESTEIII